MNWKFSIIDDDTEEIIGFFNELILKEEYFLVKNFEYNQSIKKKHTLYNLYIAILDTDHKIIGKYFLSLSNYLDADSLSLIDSFELYGEIEGNVYQNELELWEELRLQKQEDSHNWLSFSVEKRMAWMRIVRIHAQYNQSKKINNVQKVVIDGNYITDPLSFYLTLGEAVNGYGGYYGEGLDSLADCLCGGFGIDPPFELQCINFMGNSNLNSFYMTEEVASKSSNDYFVKVIKLFENHNVKIIISE